MAVSNIFKQPMLIQTATITVIDPLLSDDDENKRINISGKVTGGNISMNANSPVRRTANLTIFADTKNLQHITDIDNLISINKTIELSISLKSPNGTEEAFPFGVYIITNASIAHTLQGVNISVTLKDPMVLFNGEISGLFSAETIFSPMKTIVNGKETLEKPTIKTIIETLMLSTGRLSLGQIVIEDLPDKIANQVVWSRSAPIYAYTDAANNLTLDMNYYEGLNPATYIMHDAVGYQIVPFVFPGEELVGKAGESISSVLDKIQKALGNYEYFFDTDGVFHFRAIKNFLYDGSASFDLTTAIQDQYGYGPDAGQSATSVFSFDDTLLVSCTNQPKYANIKNDITVWGQNKSTKTPIRYRLIIDTPPKLKAPETEKEYWVKYVTDEFGITRVVTAYTTQQSGNDIKHFTVNSNTLWQQYAYLESKLENDPVKTYYTQDLEEEWPKIYDVINGNFLMQERVGTQSDGTPIKTTNKGTLTYYIDMLDPSKLASSAKDFGIKDIGRREKVINDTKIDCLFLPAPPNVIYIENGRGTATAEERTKCIKEGKAFCQVPAEYAKYMDANIVHNSAYNKLRSILHECIGYNESISLTCVPIYELNINDIIQVYDADSDINGKYVISSISIPLALNGTMSISANKLVQQI